MDNPIILWNAFITLVYVPIIYSIKTNTSNIQRLEILINKTREEIPSRYVTKQDLQNNMQRIFDSLDKLDEKIDNKLKDATLNIAELYKIVDELKDYFIAIQKFIQKNPEAALLFISFYQDGGAAGMGSTVRVSFPYKIYTVNQRTRKPNYDDNMREEHNHPANQIHSALLYAAMEGNVEQAFPGIRASVMQGAITLEADTITNKGEMNKLMQDLYNEALTVETV